MHLKGNSTCTFIDPNRPWVSLGIRSHECFDALNIPHDGVSERAYSAAGELYTRQGTEMKVKSISTHVPLPFLLRGDISPFIVGYSAAIGFAVTRGMSLFHVIPLVFVFLFHLSTLLGTYWSISFRCTLNYRKVREVPH